MITHYGTFPKNVNHYTCHMFAQRALQLNFCTVDFNVNDEFMVLGWSNFYDVFVSVFCIPTPDGNTWVEVLATSNDSAHAEQLRNGIRQKIIDASIFDPPPIHPLHAMSMQAEGASAAQPMQKSAQVAASSKETAQLTPRESFGQSFRPRKPMTLEHGPSERNSHSAPAAMPNSKNEVMPPSNKAKHS